LITRKINEINSIYKMSYQQEIKSILDRYIQTLENIDKKALHKKVIEHLAKTIQIKVLINEDRPENYRMLIEYLSQEGRNFGWSFPESTEEEICEKEFWKLEESIKSIVQGMTVNERLYFFGYLDEYENLKPSINCRSSLQHRLTANSGYFNKN
jgi:hypothetical protein